MVNDVAYIYKLIDPRYEGRKAIRYIGLTRNSIEDRLKGHLESAREGIKTPVYYWIRKLDLLGLKPTVKLVEKTTLDKVNERETYWIRIWRKINKDYLLNISDGGDGVTMTDEVRKKISEANKGRKFSEEVKKKMSETRRGENNSFYGKKLSEKAKRKIGKANKGRKMSEENKKKMSDRNKGKNNFFYGQDISGEKNIMFGKKHSEETKRKISESHKKRFLQKIAA